MVEVDPSNKIETTMSDYGLSVFLSIYLNKFPKMCNYIG